MAETLIEPACRVCGCTEWEACDGGCWWVRDPLALGPLCSTCRTTMGAHVVDDDTLGPRLLAVVLVLVLIGALIVLASGPEPCTDQTTTVCGAP